MKDEPGFILEIVGSANFRDILDRNRENMPGMRYASV